MYESRSSRSDLVSGIPTVTGKSKPLQLCPSQRILTGPAASLSMLTPAENPPPLSCIEEDIITSNVIKSNSNILVKARPRPDIEARTEPVTPTSSLPSIVMSEKSRDSSESFLVTFNGPQDPKNPKNWSSRQKWAAITCIAAFTFVSPLASTMVAPALGQIRQELNITSTVVSQMNLSIFVLAFAVGPMFIGPLSELCGRVTVSQTSNVCFLIFNTLCGFATSKEQLLVYRFLAGIGGSAPLAIGGGVIGDLFRPEERGKAMGIYAMGPLLGPALGPIVGGWVTQKSTWRWMFWAVSIVDCVILFAGFLGFRETYGPYILHKKAKMLRRETGNHAYQAYGERDADQTVWRKVSSTIQRSFRMLLTEPIVQVMSLYMGFSFGILYLMLSTYAELFLTHYHENIGLASFNYISLGLGLFIGSPLCGRLNDLVYMRMKARYGQDCGRPEYRMPTIVPFSLLVPTGLLIYGWTAHFEVHWIAPNVGAFLFGIGTIAAFQCVTTYLIDTYTQFAASAIAAVIFLRSLMGFAFPLFAPAMYRALDYGWGATLLAVFALVIGTPVPVLLWFYGESLRKRSSAAVIMPQKTSQSVVIVERSVTVAKENKPSTSKVKQMGWPQAGLAPAVGLAQTTSMGTSSCSGNIHREDRF